MKKSKMLLALMLGTILSVQTAMAASSSTSGNHINETKTNQFADGNNSDKGIGGAFYTGTKYGEDVLIQNSTYENNGAKFDGGAIGIYGTGNTTIENTNFLNNTAQYTEQGGTTVTTGDNIPVGGGALSLGSNSKTNIKNSIFKGNKSGKDGGAISTRHLKDTPTNNNAKLTITGSTFEGNQAKGKGGAVYHSFSHSFDGKGSSIVESNFKNNSAEDSGGAIFNEANSAITVGGTFEGNSARYSGGAIANNGDLTVENGSIFRDNKTLWEPRNSDDYPTRASEMGTIYSEGTKDKAAKVTIGNNVTFENNTAGGGAGLYLYANNDATIGKNVTFSGNKALADKNGSGGSGGAISIVSGSNNGNGEAKLTIGDNATFDGNEGEWGGAIAVGRQDGATTNSELTLGKNATFKNNKATSEKYGYGGAIYNDGKTTIGEGAQFVNNSAAHFGGAIYSSRNSDELDLTNDDFTGNTAKKGGAIYASAQTTTTIVGGTFSGNSATGSKDGAGNPIYGQGGAIFTDRDSTSLTIGAIDDKTVTTFEGNTAENEGGAIWAGNSTSIENAVFSNNKTTGTAFTADKPNYHKDAEGGGAIFFGSNVENATIDNTIFEGNSSATVGGAIATRSNGKTEEPPTFDITNSTFSGNSAAKNGGAIASYVDVDIKDSSFTGNSAGEKGGAVWANSNVTVTATKDGSDVVFSGNSAKDGGDIFMDSLEVEGSSTEAKIGELKFVSESDRNITLADGISGKDTYKVTKQGEGTLTFNGEIKNAEMTVESGTLHLAEGNSIVNSTITMSDGTTLDTTDGAFTPYAKDVIKTTGSAINLKADISSATGESDSFSGITGNVTLEDFNPVADTLLSRGSITTEELKKSLGLGDGATLSLGKEAQQDHIFLTPLRYLNAKADGSGISFAPTGSGYRDFNPAVMASPVAAQIGGYLNQLNSYDEAFRNMDMYMLMTKKQRKALKLRNKYAAADSNLVFDPTNTPYDDKAAWFRPYATFENVSLKGGPKVSNVAYGTYFGAESELKELGHGWDGMYGVYAGYNGSHQAYDGIGIYQNGGTLGLVGMAYKGNFFTGLTVNAGANVGEAHTYYGQDNFTMMLAGVANKTGYNWELAEGKFIIQPSLMTSYSFVNTFDYTNSAGISIDSDAMHVVTFEPGLKFIGNLKNGWQPYAGVSFVWNILDKTQFQANDASLPELSIKPFVRYGIGVRKTWGERLTGFFQTFFTNGGRNGVGFQIGFRMTLGKNGKAIKKGHTPELPKTVLKLGNR